MSICSLSTPPQKVKRLTKYYDYILPTAGYMPFYRERITYVILDDIKYSCEISCKSSSSDALIKRLDGSLVATSTRTSTTLVAQRSYYRKRPVQRQIGKTKNINLVANAQMRTGTRPTPVNRQSEDAKASFFCPSRTTGLPLVLAAGSSGDF